eukprot:gene14661-19697_t
MTSILSDLSYDVFEAVEDLNFPAQEVVELRDINFRPKQQKNRDSSLFSKLFRSLETVNLSLITVESSESLASMGSHSSMASLSSRDGDDVSEPGSFFRAVQSLTLLNNYESSNSLITLNDPLNSMFLPELVKLFFLSFDEFMHNDPSYEEESNNGRLE